ncbi:mucin-5AC [Anabrus simplex]|uniref:mucin-5AC n=1 Tax=Anabrus simplex TaxID=316456 RepID=UPI0035A2C34A
MDLARSSQSQSRRTSHGDPSATPRPEDVQPTSVLFREIHKNAWLKKLPSSEKRTVAFPKKGDRVWVVFCVHDDSEAFLELYSDQKVAVTHKPDWFVSLNNCLHVSPTICAQEDEYEFVITLSSDLVRLTAPSWELMMEWVETIRSKLQEMRILSPRENLYSKMPEARLPLAPTRDPNSPLPPPPAGPSTLVPGVEPVHSENSDGSSSSGSSVEVTNNAESPSSSSSSSSPSSSSDDSSQPSQPTVYDNAGHQVRTSAATSLYITQSEPPVYTRPRQVLSRAASVPDSPSYSLALMTPPCPSNSDPSDNITVIEVSSNHHIPHSALPLEPQGVFNFSFIEDALPSLQENRRSEPLDPWSPHGEGDMPDVYYTPPVTPARNSDRQLQNQSVVVVSSASNSTNIRRVENGRTNLRAINSSSLVDITNTSSNAHYECVFFPTQSPSVTDQSAVSIAPTSAVSPATTSRMLHNEGNISNSASTTTTVTTVVMSPSISRNSSSHGIGPMETSNAGLLLRRRRRSSSTSETSTTASASHSSPRPVPAERSRVPSSNTAAAGTSPRPEAERRLQPAPHPYRQVKSENITTTNPAVGTGRLTLREQQVLQLRREMMHPGGVRLQLRRKDCTNSIALVDAFGAVWVAGWKQREHPMLYNALHIGDQLLSTAGVLVQSASDAQKLIRGATSLYVEFVIRRVPCGRVFAIRRDTEGQNLGIVQEGNTAEIRDVLPNSPAARHGLVPRTQTCDGLSLTNWVLTEINGRPLNLFFKDGEVRDRLNAVGREISILVQPFDLVKQLKKQLKAIRGYKDYIVQ